VEAEDKIGRFQKIRRLGTGGMGEVWLCGEDGSETTRAVKILKNLSSDTDPDAIERFGREARAIAQVEHPNVIRIYEADLDGAVPHMVMEYAEGGGLNNVIDRGERLSPERVIAIAIDAASGLAEAHKCGLTHRDIKPGNLLQSADGHTKVADLGLVRFADSKDQSLTASGFMIGTPLYVAPEQASNAKTATHQSDIYSLGATMYHLLVGDPPFEGDTALETVMQHMNEPVPDPRQTDPELPAGLCAVICKMMEKNPQQRYPDMDALLKDLRLLQEHGGGYTRISADVVSNSMIGAVVDRPVRSFGLGVIVPFIAVMLVAALLVIPRDRNPDSGDAVDGGEAVTVSRLPASPDVDEPSVGATASDVTATDLADDDPAVIYEGIERIGYGEINSSKLLIKGPNVTPVLSADPSGENPFVAAVRYGKGKVLVTGHHNIAIQSPQFVRGALRWFKTGKDNTVYMSKPTTFHVEAALEQNLKKDYQVRIWEGQRLAPGDVVIFGRDHYQRKVRGADAKKLHEDIHNGARMIVGMAVWSHAQTPSIVWYNELIEPMNIEMAKTSHFWKSSQDAYVIDRRGKSVAVVKNARAEAQVVSATANGAPKPAKAIPPITLEDGLVVHLQFNGGFRNIVTGTIQKLDGPRPTFEDGPIGEAAVFGGKTFLDLERDDISMAGDFTFAAWVRTKQSRAVLLCLNPPDQARVPEQKAIRLGGSLLREHGKYRRERDEGQFNYDVYAKGRIRSPEGVSDGQYHHLVVVQDLKGGTVTMYVDGKVVSTSPANTVVMRDPVGGRIRIGATNAYPDKPRSEWSYFNGGIDDLRIYNRPLAAAEIEMLHVAGATEGPATVEITGDVERLLGTWTFKRGGTGQVERFTFRADGVCERAGAGSGTWKLEPSRILIDFPDGSGLIVKRPVTLPKTTIQTKRSGYNYPLTKVGEAANRSQAVMPDPAVIFQDIKSIDYGRVCLARLDLAGGSDTIPVLGRGDGGKIPIVAAVRYGKGRALIHGHEGLTKKSPQFVRGGLKWFGVPKGGTIYLSKQFKFDKSEARLAADLRRDHVVKVWAGERLAPGQVFLFASPQGQPKILGDAAKRLQEDIHNGACLIMGMPLWSWKGMTREEIWYNQLIAPMKIQINLQSHIWGVGGSAQVFDKQGKSAGVVRNEPGPQ
jgi:hypothetical protein